MLLNRLGTSLMLHLAKRSSELLALHLVNTGATAWHDINKRLRDFLWIQVIAFNGEGQGRNNGTLRTKRLLGESRRSNNQSQSREDTQCVARFDSVPTL